MRHKLPDLVVQVPPPLGAHARSRQSDSSSGGQSSRLRLAQREGQLGRSDSRSDGRSDGRCDDRLRKHLPPVSAVEAEVLTPLHAGRGPVEGARCRCQSATGTKLPTNWVQLNTELK